MFSANQIFGPWIDNVSEKTGGMLKIEPYYGETLVSLPDTYDALAGGVVDIAHSFQNMTPGRFLMDEVINFSTYNLNCWRASLIMWELYEKYPEWRAQYSDVKVLYLMSIPYVFPGTSKKPIRTLEDHKGLKMIISSETIAMRGEALGWVPTPVPPGEVYSSLEKGVVDGGGIFLMDTLTAFGWGETINYLTLVPIGRMPMFVAMNLDKWNSLPNDLQKVLEEFSGQRMAEISDQVRWGVENELSPTVQKDFGLEYVEVPPEELARWVEADKVAVDQYLSKLADKGLPGKEFFDEYLRLEKKYSAEEYAIK
jgi:TRAP-type C4-dicarboxylate transport system substrate-binding protein